MTRRIVRTGIKASRDLGIKASPHRHELGRRGVSSVLAMMFLVIFGSLCAAMAVVAQSNLRTADSSLKLSRAMSAAETGMVFATRRLASESARFVVEKGVIDSGFGERIWMGTYNSGDGDVTILQPTGYNTGPGVIHALRDAHGTDQHNIVVSGAPTSPTIDPELGRLRVPAVALSTDGGSAYFLLTYELLADSPYVRVTSQGVDGDVKRTLQMDYKIDKKIEFAVLSPNRIMIGKNVLIDGPLGSRYGLISGELDSANGDPLVMRSDFYYLDDELSVQLDTLFDQVKDYDADGDNRLRPDHPQESLGLAGHAELVDADDDEYVDDFDLFLNHFDGDHDHRVVYDADLASAAGLGSLSVEYGAGEQDDRQLLRLIDQANADRDGDGTIAASDISLGYNDGVIDDKDQYAKVRGKLAFAVARAPWDSANGASYQTVVKGAIRSDLDVAPVEFEVGEDRMREITTEMFAESQTWFSGTATGNFAAQAGAPDPGDHWEPVPYGAVEAAEFGTRGAYDYYNRPVYRDKTFTNVRIPKNTNALFENCTFVGVTYVETNPDCDDVNWNYTGAKKKLIDSETGEVVYVDHFPGLTSSTAELPIINNTRTESNNIRFHNCTILGSISGDRPLEYTHWRNKLQMSGNTRFYIDPADPDLAEQPDAGALITLLNTISAGSRAEMEKSSVLMPGWSIDVGNFTNEQAPNPGDTPKVKLKGTIIAGIMDVRGTADVRGTLLMTFRPTEGQGPLFYGGLLDSFNTTIGYFHMQDGDGEGGDPGDADFEGFGEITLRYDPNAKLPDGIPWPIRIDADPTTYVE